MRVFIDKLVEWKQTDSLSVIGVIFFDIKLLLRPDVVFDSESNGRNLNCLAPPAGEKKITLSSCDTYGEVKYFSESGKIST